MRPKAYLSLFFCMLVFISIAQTGGVNPKRSECTNFNSYLDDPVKISQLQQYAYDITSHGRITFDIEQTEGLEDISILHSMLDVDAGSTFALEKVMNDPYNDVNEVARQHLRYKQLHNGLEVIGGGYTAERVIIVGPPGPGGGFCDHALYALNTYISSKITISTTPTISESQLPTILNAVDIYSENLKIAPHLLEDCNYNLVWETHYKNSEGAQKIAFVDAHSGSILRIQEDHKNLTAPVTNLPSGVTGPLEVSLDDGFPGPSNSLRTADGTVFTHYDPACLGNGPTGELNDPPAFPYDLTTIPFATTASVNNGMWGSEATPHVYQTHYIGKQVLDEVNALLTETLGPSTPSNVTNISNLRILACEGAFDRNSAYPKVSSFAGTAYIRVPGGTTSSSFAVRDVMAHEIAHIVLGELITRDETQEDFNIINEGISDIFGTYIEYILQGGNVDWEIMDDPTGSNQNLRNLSNPVCANTVSGNLQDRGLVLGHWFYLMSTGDATLGITQVGIEETMKVVMGALNNLSVNSDYESFRLATLTVIDRQFGACSPEGIAARRAWAAVCVGDPSLSTYNCAGPFGFEPKFSICASVDYLYLSIDGTAPGVNYKWKITVLGSNSVNWDMNGSQVGNSTHLGDFINHFQVTDFPNYPYYPRYFRIIGRSPVANVEIERSFRILGCDGEPTCEEYYNGSGLQINDSGLNDNIQLLLPNSNSIDKVTQNNNVITTLRVYSILGELLFEGAPSEFDKYSQPYTGMVVKAYFNQNNQFVKSEKEILVREF